MPDKTPLGMRPLRACPVPPCSVISSESTPCPGSSPFRVPILSMSSRHFVPGAFGASWVPRRISSSMPRPILRRPSTPSPFSGCFVLPSSALKPSATSTTFRSCNSSSGSAISPTAYWILCVRLPHLLFAVACSAMRSTLDTGGWLALTRQGLSPRKIRRASPSAITPRSAAAYFGRFVARK